MKTAVATILVAVFGFPLEAQVNQHPFVRASGQASVFVPPDQAKSDVSIATQGASAQEASARNADQVTTVLSALGKLLGSGADIKTINYFVGPVYKNPPGGGPPTVVGYTASSTLEVTLNNLLLTGAVIDTATQAGATSIGGLRFTLQNSDPPHLQALRLATLQAKAHADAIASGLGRTVGAVISVEEGTGNPVPPIYLTGTAAPSTSTPVEPGLIEVHASIVLDAELN